VSNADESWARAHALLGANLPKQALEVIYPSLAINPDDAAMLRLAAQAHLAVDPRAGSAQNAISAAQRSLELEPDNAHGWRLLAVAHSRTRSHGRAHEAAETAQRLEPNGWQGHVVLADVDAAADNVDDQTRAAVRTAISLAPQVPGTHFAAARVAMASNNRRAAARHYQDVLAIDPTHAAARNNLAIIQMRRGNTGRAAASFVGLLAENPNSTLALLNLRATAFRALRVVYIVLAIALVALNGYFNADEESPVPAQARVWSVGVAVLAVVSIATYTLWVRRRAGAYFGRFVRSMPKTDKVVTAWAAVLAVCAIALVSAVFVPSFVARIIYADSELVMIVCALGITAINLARRRQPGK
jgi:tetratricopeptide (TPR) repeat protein